MRKTITIEYEITEKAINVSWSNPDNANSAEVLGVLEMAKNAFLKRKAEEFYTNKH